MSYKGMQWASLAALMSCEALAQTQASDILVAEKLSRGAIAVPAAAGQGMLVSWRLLGTDASSVTFDVLRDGEVVADGLAGQTDYFDENGQKNCSYQIVTRQNAQVLSTDSVVSWDSSCLQIPLNRPDQGVTPSGERYRYTPADCTVADVDADGAYEIILKWDPSNAKDNSQFGYTGNVLIDCYKMDGTQLWRIDLGQNIRAGAHYTQMLAYDFDGDGFGELILKTAPGSRDGAGRYVSQAATDNDIIQVDDTRDWRNGQGKIVGGQEWLTVFNGLTGQAIHTIFYNPNRAATYGGEATCSFDWDDRPGKTDTDYGNRGERYLAAVAYLGGTQRLPSAVFCRGYYTYAFLWAVDFDGQHLATRWLHFSKSPNQVALTDADGKMSLLTYNSPTGRASGSATAYANGNHNLSVADVDADGYDEIVYGSAAVDHDGRLLYATGFGHGDAIHLGDLVPSRPGLEVFSVHESAPYGWDLHDAATGEILYSSEGRRDNGRGLAADISAAHEGYEFWSLNDRMPRSASTGKTVGEVACPINFRIYWDADLQDELLDGTRLYKWSDAEDALISLEAAPGQYISDIHRSRSCNGSKNTPCLQADLFGDWREEIIFWDGEDCSHLNVMTTCFPTAYRVPTLMHDHVYRLAVAWQNVGYNQPPHLGYYLPNFVNQ